MLTPGQQRWLEHLSNTDIVKIVPWDPTSESKFLRVKKRVQGILGQAQAVEHRGASSLKISGQDEIDVYVPVAPGKFDEVVDTLKKIFGEPRSNYPFRRARFVTEIEDKHIDVFVINKDDKGWKESEMFNNYLLANPAALNDYRIIKEKASGKSVREYYETKINFINRILREVKSRSNSIV